VSTAVQSTSNTTQALYASLNTARERWRMRLDDE